MADLFSLDGKVAMITGASRGLGWAMARAMAEAGAHVVINGRASKTVDVRVAELADDGLAASAAPFDVTGANAPDAVAGVAARLGRLDVFVANAGIVRRGALDDVTIDDWQRIIDTNLTAAFTLAHAASRAMVEQGSGTIIMMGSIMGVIARTGVPAYVASKGGIASLTRALAVELGPKGVTCNAMAPGDISTDMTAYAEAIPEFDELIKRRTPLGRWGRAEEIASVAVFLASPAASYVNGHVLTADGGLTAAL